jgi:O-antigen/teichoic acid export membrane protein
MLAPSAKVRFIQRLPFGDVVPWHYALLRGWTAGSALLAGLLQTFVFARVLEPERFSLFLVVGALGVSMWLFDLGLPKILFVGLRKRFLKRQDTSALAAQATALTLLYAALVGAGALICFIAAPLAAEATLIGAAEFALFFLFAALNLPWFVLRNVSVAFDEFSYFETLDALRRVVFIVLLITLLAGLPFGLFVLLINASWAVLFTLAAKRLIARQALIPQFRGTLTRLRAFFRDNRASAWRTGIHAASEVYVHNVLYLVVPLTFGLGAPVIIVDTALKIFSGVVNLCSAACDLLVPRQTAAYAERDARMLMRTTLTAIALCALPAVAVGAILLVDADFLFRLLLGHSAAMPWQMTPLLLVLLGVAVAKSGPNFLLQHTGYFAAIARLAGMNAVVMTGAIAIALLFDLGLVWLFALYAAAFVSAAAFYLVAAFRGPIQDAKIRPKG